MRKPPPAGVRGARSGCTHTQCVGERARDCRLGVGMRGVQRTRKIRSMFLTREVSQLSDWLKARASCRGSQAQCTRGLAAGRAARGGGGRDAVGMQKRGRDRDPGGSRRGSTHLKHAEHTCDAGGVPAQRLVELVRSLPKRSEAHSAHGAGRAARAAGGGRQRASAVCARTACVCRGEGATAEIGGHGAGSSARQTSTPCP